MVNSLFNWLIVGSLMLLHPFYVSKIEINHNTKDKSLELSIRVFTDDLETTLQKFGSTKIDLSKKEQAAVNDKLIKEYVHKNLQLMVDKRSVNLEYVGYEINKESTWLYFEVDNVPILKELQVNCSLLYDYKTEQMNIIQVKANGKDESYKLDYPKKNVLFNLL
jgi:hypothetical protein